LVHTDFVVVAGIERDVVAAGFGDGADHVQSLVPVEGSDLDGDHVLDFGEAPPERIRQHASAGGRLEVKAEQRDNLSNRPAVNDECVFARVLERTQAEKAGVEAELANERRFAERLPGPAAKASDADARGGWSSGFSRSGRVRAERHSPIEPLAC